MRVQGELIIEEVGIYLDQLVSFKGGCNKETSRRIKRKWASFWGLRWIYRGKIGVFIITDTAKSHHACAYIWGVDVVPHSESGPLLRSTNKRHKDTLTKYDVLQPICCDKSASSKSISLPSQFLNLVILSTFYRQLSRS